jgi:hypothetical protein
MEGENLLEFMDNFHNFRNSIKNSMNIRSSELYKKGFKQFPYKRISPTIAHGPHSASSNRARLQPDKETGQGMTWPQGSGGAGNSSEPEVTVGGGRCVGARRH